MDAPGKKTALYHKVASSLDLTERRYSEAEAHLVEAAHLEPGNPMNQLSLCALRLQRGDPQVAAEARANLLALATNPIARPDALRQLAQDSLRHTNLNGALAFSNQLLADTNSQFMDRMVHLELLRATTNLQEAAALAAVEEGVRQQLRQSL